MLGPWVWGGQFITFNVSVTLIWGGQIDFQLVVTQTVLHAAAGSPGIVRLLIFHQYGPNLSLHTQEYTPKPLSTLRHILPFASMCFLIFFPFIFSYTLTPFIVENFDEI